MGDDFRLDVRLLFIGRREADLLMDAVNTEERDVKKQIVQLAQREIAGHRFGRPADRAAQ